MNKLEVDVQLSPAVLISIHSKSKVFSRPGIPQTISCGLHIAFACVMVVIAALRVLNERGTAVPHPCKNNVNWKAHCEIIKMGDNIWKKKPHICVKNKELTFGKISHSPLQEVYGGVQTHMSPTRT